MKVVKWVHISDLHMNKPGVETRRLRAHLIDLLKSQSPLDYVFITGDLQYAPNEPNISEAAEYLKLVIESCGTPLNHVFIVPGNHDVDRDDKEREIALERVFGEEGYYKSHAGTIEAGDLVSICNAKPNFIAVMNSVYRNLPDRLRLYDSNTSPHFVIATEDLNVIHLDTTISYGKERQNNLYVGGDLLYGALEKLEKDKPSIIITHYSFDFLNRAEQNEIFAIMKDKGIRLWFAGHEHNNLIRKQRDYFYEFQAGNLMLEGDINTKSCIIRGEINLDTQEGAAVAYCWEPYQEWVQYPFLGAKNEGVYYFDLGNSNDSTDRATNKDDVNNRIPVRFISENLAAVNLYSLNDSNLEALPDTEFNIIRSEMGTRLKGNETKEQITSMFLAEIHMTINAGKRYGILPLFRSVIRDIYDGFLYINNEIAPLDKVKVYHMFYEDYDCYQIEGDKYALFLRTVNNKREYYSIVYTLSDLKDVQARIYYFEKIDRILHAKRILVNRSGQVSSYISADTPNVKEESNNEDSWHRILEQTERWFCQMKKLAEIEKFFHIKFELPKIANKEDFNAIRIIYNSITENECSSIKGIPFSEYNQIIPKMTFSKTLITEHSKLPPLILFNYRFIPQREYFLSCELVKNRKKKIWETKEGGIPICVDFEVQPIENINKTNKDV